MATKKQTTSQGRSTAKKTTAAKKKTTKSSAKRKTTAQPQKTGMVRSVVLFAFGLLFIVMLFVEGLSAWAAVRTFLFGVFGASFYFLGVALLYLAVVIAQQEPWIAKAIKITLGMATLSGTAILFSSFAMPEGTFAQGVSAFYQNGTVNATETFFSGGLLGAVIGGPLLAFCGRPAANILMIILLLCAIMLLTGITPAEVADFVGARLGSAKVQGDKAREAFLENQEQRNAARAQRAELQARKEAEYATAMKAKMPSTEELELCAPEEAAPAAAQGPAAQAAAPAPAEDANEPKPWFKLFARQTKSLDPDPAQPASRAFFDIDLGPSAAQIKTGQSEPIEPIEIGPGGTFGLEAVRGVASVPLVDLPETNSHPVPPEPDGFWQVPVEESAAQAVASASPTSVVSTAAQSATAMASATAGTAASQTIPTQPTGVEAQSVPTAVSDTFPVGVAQDGWISMGDDPDAVPSGGAEIEHLVAAAMDKPALADAAAAALPEPELPAIPSYEYPPIHLFEAAQDKQDRGVEAELKANAQKLVDTLDSFGVKTRVLDISRGPSVTRYELQPLAGVKISRITNLSDDIALNLSVAGVRIEAPIPGKPAVGIEVPNRHSTSVAMRSVLESKNYTRMDSPLSFALGKDIAGVAQVADLCKMPHLLVAGSTGSGKSVCVNSIIMSFLFRASPEELKLILIDPKVVELAEYNGIPHLLMPVVTEPRKAAGALGSAVAEMEKRYRLFADNNVRDIKTYNKLAQNSLGMEHLPYIAIVIDELADLMMVAGKEVEDYICRIAQKARAAGMHLLVATQRPSVDVITGLIKANIPSRISFAVSSQIDSRTILDSGGAEKLLGMGDMLFMPVGASKPVRIQGTYVKDEEISRVLSFLKEGGGAQYDEEMIAEMEKVAANQKGAAGASGKGDAKGDNAEGDPMLKQCAEVVIEAGQASTSLLQRRCKLGYARAARIMDEMEQLHIIGPYEGAKPRAVLVSRQQWIEMCMNEQEGTEG